MDSEHCKPVVLFRFTSLETRHEALNRRAGAAAQIRALVEQQRITVVGACTEVRVYVGIVPKRVSSHGLSRHSQRAKTTVFYLRSASDSITRACIKDIEK